MSLAELEVNVPPFAVVSLCGGIIIFSQCCPVAHTMLSTVMVVCVTGI